jgi:hypothetical protein
LPTRVRRCTLAFRHANAGGKQLQEAREDNVRAYPITKIIAPLALLALATARRRPTRLAHSAHV